MSTTTRRQDSALSPSSRTGPSLDKSCFFPSSSSSSNLAAHTHTRSKSGLRPSLSTQMSSQNLGVLYTGYLDKLSSPSTSTTINRNTQKKRRFIVLTPTALRWYKRAENDELFGESVGSVLLKDIHKITLHEDGLTFTMACSDRRRVFVASHTQERDIWVESINIAMKKQQFLANAANKGGGGVTGSGSSPVGVNGGVNGSINALLPQIEMVLVKDSSHKETVHGHELAYGVPLRLVGVEVEDLVMVRLSFCGYLPLEGKVLKAAMEKEKKTQGEEGLVKVVASSGEGYGMVRIVASVKKEEAWFKAQEITEMWVVALFAMYSMNLLSLLVLGYIIYYVAHAYQRSLHALGAIDLTVETFEFEDEHTHTHTHTHTNTTTTTTASGSALTTIDESLARSHTHTHTHIQSSSVPPHKFVEGCQGDMVEARRRWDITRAWREEFKIDDILEKPHPHFSKIKKHWPHFFLPLARNGDAVYLERTGEFKMPLLQAEGIGVDELLHHCVYSTEYFYRHILQHTDTHAHNVEKLITIYDLTGASFGDLRGDAKVFLKRGIGLIQQHYPERSRVILIVAAPTWFSLLWKLLKQLLHPSTQAKIRIAAAGKETTETLKEFIDEANIPLEYGGKLQCVCTCVNGKLNEGEVEGKDGCRWHSPQEDAMRKFVLGVNARFPPGTPYPAVAPPHAHQA